MVRLKMFSFIVLLYISTVSSQQPLQCDDTMPTVNSMKPDFGGIDGFYSMAKGISDGLQSTPNQKTYDDLNNLIFGNGAVNADQVIKDMVVNQIGAIVFWSFGFVFVLAALVLGIATGIWQCCYSCVPKEGSIRSKYTGYVYSFLLFTMFSLTLSGIILFNITESKLTNSIDNAMDYTSEITMDLSGVMGNGTKQLVCEVNTTTSQTFSDMNNLISNYSKVVVDGTSDAVGLTAVNTFDDNSLKTQNQKTLNSANELQAKLEIKQSSGCDNGDILKDQVQDQSRVRISLESLSTATTAVRQSNELNQINTEMNSIKSDINTQAQSASNSINTAQQSISDTVASINSMLDDLQHTIDNVVNSIKTAHRDVMSSGGYTAIKIVLRIFVTVPAVLGCAFAVFAIAAIVLSLKERDGIALKLAPWVLVTFYITIVLSIILLLLSSVAFVGGWLTSAMCVPIFEDSDYHLFHLMNQTIQPQKGVPNPTPDVVNIGGVLQQCQDSSTTIFTAINGTTIISADSITQQLNLNQIRDNANNQINNQNNQQYTVDPNYQTWMKSLSDQLAEAKAVDISTCSAEIQTLANQYINDLASSVAISNEFVGNLNNLNKNAPKVTSIAQEKNNEQFNRGDSAINSSISNLMNNLENNVFKCQPLVKIYNNGGFVMCEQFGKPIQGLWASIGLCGVVLFLLAILLLLTYRWLKTGDELSTIKTPKGSKRGKKKSFEAEEPNGGSRQLGNKNNSGEGVAEFPLYPSGEQSADPVHRLFFTSPNGSTARRLPRVRPLDIDQPTTSSMDYDQYSSSYYPRGVQVLPDSRHPPMSPNFYDTEDSGTRTRFDDVDLFGGDYQSNSGSTTRGLRRY